MKSRHDPNCERGKIKHQNLVTSHHKAKSELKQEEEEVETQNPKMPPKKKPNNSSSSSSSSKKPIPQPSKYGIQHFFDRHTTQHQNSQKLQSNHVADAASDPPEKSNDAEAKASGASSQASTPVNEAHTLSEVSPEMSKTTSRKRFKFSPGMVT